MPSGGVSGLGELSMEWWETVFPERAPEGETYEPAVDPVGSPIWDWSGLIAGALVFNVGYFVANRRLPILRLDQTPRGIPRNL